MNTMNIETINEMSRTELITETLVGSIIAYANFKSFNFKEAAHILVHDPEMLAEACRTYGYPADFFVWTAYEQVLDENQAAIAKRIGERLAETMPTEVMW